ncbi:HAD family phosphatase [Nocardiopsis sp. FIRDI 009]|uniref:HAD family hydrolase n=1 Tax=Nocardiopsis sp. FIRDI 009 TaxID=714197 RepID=UPI000E25429F|nr:HAD-IA family hydrolase [Nocardiopsis sp. FIRDI 009]
MGDYAEATVLFDLDGVLVDSGASIAAGLTAWARERGLDVGEVLRHHAGRTDLDLVRLVAPHLAPGAEAHRIQAHEVARAEDVDAMPHARELIAGLDARRRPWAIVTSGGDLIAHARLEAAGLPFPEVLVTADHVTEGKPHPAPYLLGAERMGTAPERCVVVEDSPSGVRAGRSAGMPVIAVASTHTPEELAEATVVAADLREVADLLL